jgi:hypothetical protein
MTMSVDDGGSPFVAQADALTTSTPSGTWTATARNTGTSASPGTTTINFNANGNGIGYLLPGTGQGWTRDTGDRVRTCTNDAAVPAGGSLPPLTFPFAAMAGYRAAQAIATLTNPERRNHQQQHPGHRHPRRAEHELGRRGGGCV